MKTKEHFLDGQTLLIDKPLNWSSFQAVNSIKWSIRRKFELKKIKVGHAGTLDPLATGLLLICTGKSTKTINELQGQAKEYTGTITLGGTTPSYDLESEINETFPTEHITEAMIKDATQQFLGEIEQAPPIFSALKKDGKRLYEYAREGLEVEIKKRLITIHEFEITGIEATVVSFRVACSKGTYIRSLAHDFGIALNSGAHLSSLRRTKIGDYNVDNAITTEEFNKLLNPDVEENL
ncbi:MULTISPECIES: tRNA pseudouridine(55) synthase TruB [Cellulophaga]|uniref:tRNA pseudouridine(55) synthase TruB n=1 Tax=Cellulophaga TaxID=104264 RepID=UPI0004195839|nr:MULTISPECIES: tRNA pseudouridine(55) synthase TruB [Cellulophaga]AIY12280.1 pseudouridine synthase [Cellulophaga baltica NN016038]KGK29238.1 pseudouridine synthase [Cellulophaga sp. E6(2014)]MBA6315356.1 tRNA pseudouridine(55) synthase TruB [Cellulophaga baltica]